MTSTRLLRPALLAALLTAAAACSDSTAPLPPLNEAGLQGDVTAAQNAASAPAAVALGRFGGDIGEALGGAGGSFAIAGTMTKVLGNQAALLDPEVRAELTSPTPQAATIPAEALGRTFVWDPELFNYVVSDLAGAPANGVRFLLYAVNQLTGEILDPLVQVGYADLTRTVSGGNATVRLQVVAVGAGAGTVVDYTVRVESGGFTPSVIVDGFMRNQADSLDFRLETTVNAIAQSLRIDWRTALPTRDLVTRITQTLDGGGEGSVTLDGVIRSGNGQVSMRGSLAEAQGGTVTVRVNGDVFARITVPPMGGEPTITGADGAALTPIQVELLERIFEWFQAAFLFLLQLLAPVGPLLDVAL